MVGELVGVEERDLGPWESIRAGDEGPLERVFALYLNANLDRLYALAAVILLDRSEAEEATHDAVCAAWRGLSRLRDPQRMEAWFTRILVNTCRNHLRRRRVRPLAVELPETLPTAGGLGDAVALDDLERALNGLPAEQRTVVVLRFWGDLTLQEIAKRTGEREGTVKSRLHYALARLRASYASEPGETGGAR